MKKLISFFLTAFILFAVSACSETSDINEPANRISDSESETNVRETMDIDNNKQEESSQVNDEKVKEIRQCIQCGRVIGASKYVYCDGCRCRHIRGCALPRNGRSSYCVSHSCMQEGCTLERDINSNYCHRHRK